MFSDHEHAADAFVDPDRASTFLVGRDVEGHWTALETSGRSGGWFASQEAAQRYASFETGHRFGAVRLTPETMALPL